MKIVEPFLFDKNRCISILQDMLLSRYTDDKMAKMVRQNKGATFQLSAAGHEMVGVVAAKHLISGKDWGLPYYRDQPFAIGIGADLKEIFGAFLARAVPHHSGGRMMPGHFSHKSLHIPCQSSVVGSQFLQAVGVAQGLKLLNKDEIVYVSGGDGSTSQGDYHEALNYSALHKLGVIFMIQDNGFAISVPLDEQTSGGSVASISKERVGLKTFEVSGSDYVALSEAMEQAVQRARLGVGPSVIVAKVPRLAAHSSSDDPQKYKSVHQIEQEKAQDPIPAFESWLQANQILSMSEIDALKATCFKIVENAAQEAEQYPLEPEETAASKVFVDEAVIQEKDPIEGALTQDKIVMMDAINHAIDEEMAQNKGVIVFGQDVAHGKGGVFGITRTLTEKYGKDRCFNTPLAESTIVALALGSSLDGVHKPVAEVQFADYIWTGMNQLINELSSFHYRSNGEWNCPVVIRMPCGGYIQGGPYHSQSIEAYLAHCPGLIVVIPSNAADAKGLMKSAIRSPNPVIFLEHKALYRQQKFSARQEPSKDYMVPFGSAKVVKEGSDLTVVAWGMTVLMAVEAQEKLAGEGISMEIIDLRTISPVDYDTILASVKKTGKLLIAHEAVRCCGFGAQIASEMAEKAFQYLDAPIQRVAAKDSPVPYAKHLENKILPQTSDIIESVKKLAYF